MEPITPTDLEPRKEQAALALAYGIPQADVADLVGVSDRTIRRWTHDPSFQRLRASYQARSTFELAAQLDTLQLDAVSTLVDLLHNGTEPTRLGAARTILERAARTRDEISIQRRVATLEAAALELETSEP